MKTIRSTSAALLSACALAFATVALYAAPKETPEPSPKKTDFRVPGKPSVIVKKVPAGKTTLKLVPGYRFVRTSANTSAVYKDNSDTGIKIECMCDSKGSCAMTTGNAGALHCEPTPDGCSSCWMKTTVPRHMAAVLRYEGGSLSQ